MKNRWMIAITASALLLSAGCKKEQARPDDEPVEQSGAETAEKTESTDDGSVETLQQDVPEDTGEKLPPPPDVAGVPPTAETTASGLAFIVLEEGEGGAKPTTDSVITVHYTGWTTDGEMFDSSVVRGEPIEFPLSKLIMGWQEGIPMMTKGEKRRFWIPADLAYGNSTRPGAPQGLLVFDIELLDFDMQPTVEEKE